MELWLDTTDINIISKAQSIGILDGVTTNPSLIASSGKALERVITDISEAFSGPIAIQVLSRKASEMENQGERLFNSAPNIIVKIPVTSDGLAAIAALRAQGIPVMATAIFTPLQALLALKAGANYLAPYLGKIIDLGENGLEVVEQIQKIQKTYNFPSKILVAGIRDQKYVLACAQMGLCALTMRKEVFNQLLTNYYGTEKALDNFELDWKKAAPTQLFDPVFV